MLRFINKSIFISFLSLPHILNAEDLLHQTKAIPEIPKHISYEETALFLQTADGPRKTTVVPSIQSGLSKFIRDRGNPISAVVLIEVATGNVLAMVDGRDPDGWGASSHTALHQHFPTASLFKTVVASAAIEIAGIDPLQPIGLIGGCGKVRSTGGWMSREVRKSKYDMNLKRAYGHSCNGFFAKLAVNKIGLGPILELANRFYWGKSLPADFYIPISPLVAPSANRSSVYTIGRFAAGFGYVGSSVMHTAWRTLVIANGGMAKSLRLFDDSKQDYHPDKIINLDTAEKIKKMMVATIKGGTASSAFRRYRYRKFREKMGGKTGTLTGHSPEGVTTWFTGIYPLDKPEVVVSAVTVIGDLWIFKAPNLAAEALAQWRLSKSSSTLAKAPTNETGRLKQ